MPPRPNSSSLRPSPQALLVTSTYTANLAAFVTVQSIKSSITSVEVRGAAGIATLC